MNQKKAKRLRRAAQEMAQGLPLVEYKKWDNPIYDHRLGETVKTVRGTPATMIRDCTRRVYKMMKRSEAKETCQTAT